MSEFTALENCEYEIFTQEQAIDKATRDNFTVVYGDASHLLLDLDSHYDHDFFKRIFPVFQNFVNCKIKDQWRSKSGKGQHVVIELTEPMLSLEERTMCQAILGSDRSHELLSYFKNFKQEGAESVVLFKPAKKVNEKE